MAALRVLATGCQRAAIAAADPGTAVRRHLRHARGALELVLPVGACPRHAGRVRLLALGKAAAAMAAAASEVLGDLLVGGVVVVPAGGVVPGLPTSLVVVPGSHPVPDRRSLAAGRALLAAAAEVGSGELLLVLVSGGASALAVAPAPGLALDDLQALSRGLLASGVDIEGLNAVRKHCSDLGGGGLLRAAGRAAGVWSLVLSDVIGDDPATIGSGPAVPDPTTFSDALGIVERHLPGVAAAVRVRLVRGRDGAAAETVKADDARARRARAVVIAGNGTAVAAAAASAAAAGCVVHRASTPITGDAAEAGRRLAERLLALPTVGRGAVALVAGGEPTVRVVPGGRGGRAQQLALAAALTLAGTASGVLAFGTDGIDGPTDAAGAWVDGDTVARLIAAGVDPAAALAATDAYPALDRAGALVRTGPTGTNVADVVVGLRAPC